jgi:uncharacterized membrane protein (UPF0127 family)
MSTRLDPAITTTIGGAVTSETTTSTTTTTLVGLLEEFGRTTIEIDAGSYFVAVADRPDLQRQGLMNVPDLAHLDGMLFVYRSEGPVSHWMKDTLIPLDIAFFDRSGDFVSKTTMQPCLADPCETYPSEGPALYAVEAREGVFEELGPGSRLVLLGDLDGSGKEI